MTDPRPPFEMVGVEDAPVCVDGLCEVPAAVVTAAEPEAEDTAGR